MCSGGSDGNGCRCDALCALYGDCCIEAPSFVAKEQRRGASPFICDNSNVYMLATCPAEWNDSSTRFHCEHPDTSYRDPMFNVPVTSYRTKTTYRNRHCALCHSDLHAGTTDFWSVNFTCPDAWLNVTNDEFIRLLAYNTATSSWVLNLTAHPELLMFQNPKPSTLVYSCRVGVSPNDMARTVVRTCYSSAVDTCPEDWTGEDVRAQCEAYTTHVCANGTVYRNQYCEMCNNNGSFNGFTCHMLDTRIATEEFLPDFRVLVNWHSQGERDTCQQDTQLFDPFQNTCRTAFIETENLAPDNYTIASTNARNYTIASTNATNYTMASTNATNYTMANTNATSNSSLDTCLKFRLEPHEYYIEDNNTMTVFISVYNRTLQPHEYRIENDSRLVMCWPQFDTELVPEFGQGIGYITVIGVSLSILFLALHLSVFAMTPKLRNLSSMNLASLSVSLLMMYCSFFLGTYLRNSSVPCFILAVVIHYTLLASFCWMLNIAYDINRVLRQTTTKLLLTTGKHWRRFGFYSVWSWTCPAVIVGAALAADFSTDQALESLRPGYGEKECYISNAEALLIFTVGPLFVIMVLNTIFFFWSAFLIRAVRSALCNVTTTHTHFHLFARLALIMGLTWAVGLIAGYVDILEVWYVFVILNTLQGLFIFLAFTCTKKVWRGLCAQLGLQRDMQTQGTKSAVNTGTAATWT